MKVSNILDINLEELKKDKEKNFQERLRFVELYAAWIKKHSDKEWSKQHKKFLE